VILAPRRAGPRAPRSPFPSGAALATPSPCSAPRRSPSAPTTRSSARSPSTTPGRRRSARPRRAGPWCSSSATSRSSTCSRSTRSPSASGCRRSASPTRVVAISSLSRAGRGLPVLVQEHDPPPRGQHPTRPVDMRRGHDGLAAIVRNHWKLDLYSGHLLVFAGKRGDRTLPASQRRGLGRHFRPPTLGGYRFDVPRPQ
jgi:hypothetical protein